LLVYKASGSNAKVAVLIPEQHMNGMLAVVLSKEKEPLLTYGGIFTAGSGQNR
jgi:hypothetical protein